jgi:hypothetical protein
MSRRNASTNYSDHVHYRKMSTYYLKLSPSGTNLRDKDRVSTDSYRMFGIHVYCVTVLPLENRCPVAVELLNKKYFFYY